MSRWISILATTPSGKAQFICKYCGRKSVIPDKVCRDLPTLNTGGGTLHPLRGKTCEELEKIEAQRIKTDITWNAIPRAETFVDRLRGVSREEAVALLRRDRLLFLDYVAVTASKLSHRARGEVTVLVRLEEALRYARTELERK